jgi:hypothetical protein
MSNTTRKPRGSLSAPMRNRGRASRNVASESNSSSSAPASIATTAIIDALGENNLTLAIQGFIKYKEMTLSCLSPFISKALGNTNSYMQDTFAQSEITKKIIDVAKDTVEYKSAIGDNAKRKVLHPLQGMICDCTLVALECLMDKRLLMREVGDAERRKGLALVTARAFRVLLKFSTTVQVRKKHCSAVCIVIQKKLKGLPQLYNACVSLCMKTTETYTDCNNRAPSNSYTSLMTLPLLPEMPVIPAPIPPASTPLPPAANVPGGSHQPPPPPPPIGTCHVSGDADTGDSGGGATNDNKGQSGVTPTIILQPSPSATRHESGDSTNVEDAQLGATPTNILESGSEGGLGGEGNAGGGGDGSNKAAEESEKNVEVLNHQPSYTEADVSQVLEVGTFLGLDLFNDGVSKPGSLSLNSIEEFSFVLPHLAIDGKFIDSTSLASNNDEKAHNDAKEHQELQHKDVDNAAHKSVNAVASAGGESTGGTIKKTGMLLSNLSLPSEAAVSGVVGYKRSLEAINNQTEQLHAQPVWKKTRRVVIDLTVDDESWVDNIVENGTAVKHFGELQQLIIAAKAQPKQLFRQSMRVFSQMLKSGGVSTVLGFD